MNYKSTFFIFLSLLFIGVNFSTSPLPPPYYLFRISGFVNSDSSLSVENYAIQLYGMSIDFQPEYQPINGIYLGKERPVALTDTSGYYYIEVSNWFYLDSIKAGLINYLQPIIFSRSIKVSKDSLNQVTENYSDINNSGCNSCTSEPYETRIVRFEFNFSGLDIEL